VETVQGRDGNQHQQPNSSSTNHAIGSANHLGCKSAMKNLRGRSKADPTSPSGRLNSLGWGLRELNLVLNHLEAGERGKRGPVRRDFARWPFRKAMIQVQLSHPGGSQSLMRMACRNLSRGGISLLHNGFIYPGSTCRMSLPRADGQFSEVDGVICRCIHRRGVLHELGVAFRKPVHLRDFIAYEASSGIYALERVDPNTLTGTLLLVENSTIDVSIMRHFLRETRFIIEHAGCADAGSLYLANGQARDSVVVIVCDADLPDQRGVEWIKLLREHGCEVPAIVTCADAMSAMREGVWSVRGVTPLIKPLDQDGLLRTLAECVSVRQEEESSADEEGVRTTKGDTGLPLEVAKRLRMMLDAYAVELLMASERGDVIAAMGMVVKIRGFAPSLGLPTIAAAAAAASNLGKAPLSQQRIAFKTLAQLCKDQQVRNAA